MRPIWRSLGGSKRKVGAEGEEGGVDEKYSEREEFNLLKRSEQKNAQRNAKKVKAGVTVSWPGGRHQR